MVDLQILNEAFCEDSPAYFMSQCGLTPDPWQEGFLKSQADALLLCSRQSGKSTTAAAVGVHEAIYNPPAMVLCLSPSLRQSGELFRKVQWFYHQAGSDPPTVSQSALQMELANGSRIVSLPGKEETVRGYSSVTLLLVDEAARVPDELYYSVRPMLAVSGGRLVAMTTPFGQRGWFHKEWTESERWRKIQVKATDCPRITPEFLEQERATLGDWWFRQEYMTEFVQTTDSVFSYEHIMAAMSEEVEPLFAEAMP